MKKERKIKMEGGLIDTACILPMNGPNGTITYLDYSVNGDSQLHSKEAGLIPHSLCYTEDMIVGKKPWWIKLFIL
jgi:hypothetical protein